MHLWNKQLLKVYRKNDINLSGLQFHEKFQYIILLDLIEQLKENNFISNKASTIMLPIDHYNHWRPDCLMLNILNNKSLTIQLKVRDIEKYGNYKISHLISLSKNYINTDLIFIYVDNRFISNQIEFLNNWNPLFIDKIVFMTINEDFVKKNNYKELRDLIFNQINNLILDKDSINAIIEYNFSTNIIFNMNNNILDTWNNIIHSQEFFNVGKNNVNEEKNIVKPNFDNINKIEILRDTQTKCGFTKLKSPNTYFGTELFVSVHQVQKLNAHGFKETAGTFLVAHATGFFNK